MNTKNFLLLVAGLLIGSVSSAQINILNATSPDEIGVRTTGQLDADNSDRPLPYGYVNERDILWAKTTWELIDLDERVNLPLYYPIDTNNIGSERRSLYHVLTEGIKSGKIENIYADSYFNQKLTLEDLDATLSRRDTLQQGYAQINAGEAVDDQYIIPTNITAADVMEYHIRGYWYFDTRRGALRYRLLAIAPVTPDAYSKSKGLESSIELFWVFYPDARDVLHDAIVFNSGNTAQPLSFDDLLNSRRFHGVIYKTDNVQGDRPIEDYITDNALMQLLQSREIKESIRDFEANMWNY
ncbi:MAG TPA: gliding motility protein GldN [Flavobacteriaceae bacterium]|nr:gliding motility protein GldN [Flavobacteriaceae bacterium]